MTVKVLLLLALTVGLSFRAASVAHAETELPSVIGELSCAELRNRQEILDLLAGLPACMTASYEECRYLADNSAVRSTGINWGDAQIIASARISHADLYTRDRHMQRGWNVLN